MWKKVIDGDSDVYPPSNLQMTGQIGATECTGFFFSDFYRAVPNRRPTAGSRLARDLTVGIN